MGHGITLLLFAGNHANYGGAMYVADNTSSAACSSNYECFVQMLSLEPGSWNFIVNIRFSENTANHGVNLFGGLLDRCIPNPFAEVYNSYGSHQITFTYLGNISNITLGQLKFALLVTPN